jgi:long-chain acyl-CoA synthetase
MPLTTLSDLFFEVAGYGKSACLLHKVGGSYQPISSAELVDRVRRLWKALVDLGVARGDRVALMAENGPHWPTVDFAALTAGAVTVPIYPTLLADQAAYIARDCGTKVVFAHTAAHLAGFIAHAAELPDVQHFVLIAAGPNEPLPTASGKSVTTLAALLERGAGADPQAHERSAKACRPDDLATLVYTSGTTGQPKGVMLTHGNLASNVLAGLEVLKIEPGQVALSFLPLSHSFERTVDYCYFHNACTIAYAESVQTVPKNLIETRPNLFVSVPRVYEKLLARVQEQVAASPPLRRRIFNWAVGVGRAALPWRLQMTGAPGLLGLKLKVADRLVFHKIRERLGGRFRYALSGGAPLGRDVAEFFWGAGIPIFEGYGLTETSPVITVNGPGAVRLGTVGRPVPGVTVRIAEDGEILSRGPNTMKGYWNLPKATTEAIDEEGWFHTGDIGVLEDGFLRITDRKKELIVNAYGKNVAPAPIENSLKSSPLISQAVVLGDRRKFISALLVPEFDQLKGWAGKQGISTGDVATLLADPRVRALFANEVARVNAELPSFEQVVAWELMDHEFTLETGELTPTQKVKRRVINEKYGAIIDRLYAEADAKHGG